jgi:hypothetical protein
MAQFVGERESRYLLVVTELIVKVHKACRTVAGPGKAHTANTLIRQLDVLNPSADPVENRSYLDRLLVIDIQLCDGKLSEPVSLLIVR